MKGANEKIIDSSVTLSSNPCHDLHKRGLLSHWSFCTSQMVFFNNGWQNSYDVRRIVDLNCHHLLTCFAECKGGFIQQLKWVMTRDCQEKSILQLSYTWFFVLRNEWNFTHYSVKIFHSAKLSNLLCSSAASNLCMKTLFLPDVRMQIKAVAEISSKYKFWSLIQDLDMNYFVFPIFVFLKALVCHYAVWSLNTKKSQSYRMARKSILRVLSL